MIFLRCATAGASALALAALFACSNNAPAVPQVYIQASLDPGSHPSNICPLLASASSFTIGSQGSPAQDGSSQNGAGVSVTCTVTPNADGTFNVTANAAVDGQSGGALYISGTFGAAPGPVSKITASFTQGGNTGAFKDVTECTVTYSGNQGVAAGRVWGNLECPNAVNMDKAVAGTMGFWTCEGVAEFKFENCGQ
jgi:hypothetical protein